MSVYKPWRDKEYLHRMYVKNRKTIDEIAEDCKKSFGLSVTPMTVYNNLKDFGLMRNSRNLGKRSVGGNADQKKRGGFY